MGSPPPPGPLAARSQSSWGADTFQALHDSSVSRLVFHRTRVQGGRKSKVSHCHRASAFCTHVPCLRGFQGLLTSGTGGPEPSPQSCPLFHHILFPLLTAALATRSSPPGHLRNEPRYLLKAQKATGISLACGPTALIREEMDPLPPSGAPPLAPPTESVMIHHLSQ